MGLRHLNPALSLSRCAQRSCVHPEARGTGAEAPWHGRRASSTWLRLILVPPQGTMQHDEGSPAGPSPSDKEKAHTAWHSSTGNGRQQHSLCPSTVHLAEPCCTALNSLGSTFCLKFPPAFERTGHGLRAASWLNSQRGMRFVCS